VKVRDRTLKKLHTISDISKETHVTHKYLVGILVALLLLTACGGTPADFRSTGETATTPTSIQFSWVHTIEFAGFYMAEANGYYAEEGLDVELKGGGFDEDGNYIPPVETVLNGDADFGVLSGDLLLSNRAEGKPIVAIASIYQRSPAAFASLAENNIRRPSDLVGKTVMIDLGSSNGLIYKALLSSQGIDYDSVNTLPRTDFSNDPLINGEADVLDIFITNEPVALAQQGIDINMILASDYGFDVYANAIFTTEDMLANNPDLVERFLRATLRGTQSAIDNPEEAAALSVSYNDALSLEAEAESMQRSLPLLKPAGSEIGMMRPEVWELTHDILLEQEVLLEPLDIDSAYTMKFLDGIYSE
jgi:NitT/TauT family transport system substrate-binding protein